jgi:hypothetical protein
LQHHPLDRIEPCGPRRNVAKHRRNLSVGIAFSAISAPRPQNAG